jgi:hypothetical protein
MADFSPSFVNPSYATPEQLATQRAYAAELQKRSGQDVNRPTGALANMITALTAGPYPQQCGPASVGSCRAQCAGFSDADLATQRRQPSAADALRAVGGDLERAKQRAVSVGSRQRAQRSHAIQQGLGRQGSGIRWPLRTHQGCISRASRGPRGRSGAGSGHSRRCRPCAFHAATAARADGRGARSCRDGARAG